MATNSMPEVQGRVIKPIRKLLSDITGRKLIIIRSKEKRK
jgi:hypothetical protein